eukprot:364505-Chlamydomonas_euryale.AAC.3
MPPAVRCPLLLLTFHSRLSLLPPADVPSLPPPGSPSASLTAGAVADAMASIAARAFCAAALSATPRGTAEDLGLSDSNSPALPLAAGRLTHSLC